MLVFKNNFKHIFKNLWWRLHNLERISFKSTLAFLRNALKKLVELGKILFPPSPRQSWSQWAGGEASTSCKRTGRCSTCAASPRSTGARVLPHHSPSEGRFHLFTVVLALHTGSGGQGKEVLSVSQTQWSQEGTRTFSTSLAKGHGQVQNSSPTFSNFSLQEKWFKPYWQTPGKITSRRLPCSF